MTRHGLESAFTFRSAANAAADRFQRMEETMDFIVGLLLWWFIATMLGALVDD